MSEVTMIRMAGVSSTRIALISFQFQMEEEGCSSKQSRQSRPKG